jgi:hypothetical protein
MVQKQTFVSFSNWRTAARKLSFKKLLVLQKTGLPDGFFSDQNSSFGYILEDLGMENVVIYFGHLE